MSEKRKIYFEEFYGITIENYAEQKELLGICKEFSIKIAYPKLESDKNFYPLWGVINDSIGLVGTIVMRHTPKEKILHGAKDFRNYIESMRSF